MVKMQGKKKSGRQCLLIAACAAISAQCAFSADPVVRVSESFETSALGAFPASGASGVWSGNGGTVVEGNADSEVTSPLPTATTTKVLNIAGDVKCTPADSANTLDVMVKLTAVDELETPNDNPQVALAVAKNASDSSKVDLKIYAKKTANATEATDWIGLKAGLTAETWARITLFFDYTKGTVRVSYNCEYIGDYYLINTGSKINSLTFSGSTSIDDVVMTATAAEEYNPYKDASGNELKKEVTVGTGEKLDVSLNDLAKWGVSASADLTEVVASDGSGMKIADKLVAGLTPVDGKKFELKTMAITANTATLTFPGTAPNERYTVIASTDKDGNSPISGAKTTISNDGTGKKAEVTLPENPPDVIYFKVKAAVPAVPAAE